MSNRRPKRDELERLFEYNVLSRGQFIAGLTALGVSTTGIGALLGSAPHPAEAQLASARYLVLIVMDAFRPEYQALGPMPALDALVNSGTSYDRAWVGQLASETPTGHATLSTGSLPRNDGIPGFEWRDPKTGAEVLDGWPKGVLSDLMDRDLRQAGANSIPLAVKAADPVATVVALSSEKVYAADAMGGWAADYTLFCQRGPKNVSLLPAAVPGHVPHAEFLNQPHLRSVYPLKHFTDWDYLSALLALAAFQTFRPKVLMVNLPGPDIYGHLYGGPATPKVMADVVAGVDRNIARIVDAYKAAGIFDQSLFVVTADHGMVPNSRAVDGTITKEAVRRAGGQYLFHTGGTSAEVYLKNPRASGSVATAMKTLPNVTASYYQIRWHGSYEYVLEPTIKLDPSLDAAYRYLLGTFAGPIGPDVVAPFRENTIGRVERNAHGDHGGLNWGAQHIPLVMSGPGVRSGATSSAPARLVDVAPTILRLLDLPAHGMDGTVLADVLVAATTDEVAPQQTLGPALTAYQDALMAQSQSDIDEDNRSNIHPPPASALRP